MYTCPFEGNWWVQFGVGISSGGDFILCGKKNILPTFWVLNISSWRMLGIKESYVASSPTSLPLLIFLY